MATITRKPSKSFEVQWYVNGKRKSKTFKTRNEAKKFAAFLDLSPEDAGTNITFLAAMDEYEKEVTSGKRSRRSESIRLNVFRRRNFATKILSNLTQKDFLAYIEERKEEKSPKTGGTIASSTINKEIAILMDIFNFAIEQGWMKENPLRGIPRQREPEHRERIATESDIEKLMIVSGWDGKSTPQTLSQLTVAAFIFSCRTGMRSGEILSTEDSWIDGNVIHLPAEATKTFSKRDVALSTDALAILKLVLPLSNNYKPFGLLNDKTRDVLFRKLRDKADLGPRYDSHGRLVLEGLNFHDARATFATWAASINPDTGAPRLDVLALARQTGHKNLKMLQRYYRESASEIAKRLG